MKTMSAVMCMYVASAIAINKFTPARYVHDVLIAAQFDTTCAAVHRKSKVLPDL